MSDGSVKIDVDLNKDKANQSISGLNSDMQNMAKNISKSMQTAGKNLTKYVTLPIVGMATGMGKAAMDLEATQAKYNTVFQGMTKEADAFVTEFQKLTPATRAEANTMASGIQDLLVPLGFMRDEATGMTGEFMHVSGALANFNSGSHTAEQVTSAMSSAITGSYESLKGLGIQLDQNTVKEKAYEMGLIEKGGEVTKQIAAEVLLAEVYRQSGDALEAYTEENLDAKTKMLLLKSEIIDVAAQLGNAMLPAINKVIDLFRSFTQYIGNMSEEQQRLVAIIGLVAAAIGPLLLAGAFLIDSFLKIQGAMAAVSGAVSAAGGIFGMLQGVLGVLLGPVGLIIGAVTILAGLFIYVYNQSAMLRDMVGELVFAFQNLLDGTGSFSEVFEAFGWVIEEFLLNLREMLPELIWMGVDMILNFLSGIRTATPELLAGAVELLINLMTTFQELFPMMVDIGRLALINLASGLVVVLPSLLQTAISIGLSLLDAFISFLPTLIETGIVMLKSLISGLIATLPYLLESGYKILISLINLIAENFPKFVEKGKEIIRQLKDGLIAMLPDLIQGAVTLMVALLAKILEYGPQLFVAAVGLIWELIKGLLSLLGEVIGALNEIGNAIVDAAMSIDLFQVGKDIVSGLWKGISSMGGWVKDKVGGFFTGITEKVKQTFDTHSPSVVFEKEIGEMLPRGAVKGVENEEATTKRKIGNSFKGVIGAAASALDNIKMPNITARAVNSLPISNSHHTTDNTPNKTSESDISALLNMLGNLSIVLEDGTFVGKLAPKFSKEIERLNRLDKRGSGVVGG